MKDTRMLNVREAAQYLGCSPNVLRRLRRWGWLKSIQDLEYAHVQAPYSKERLAKSKFYVWQMEVVAWDFAYSLSFYDIVVIRQSERAPVDIAKLTGIPRRVVEVVKTSEVFGWLLEIFKMHAPKREGKSVIGFDVKLPFPPDARTLPRIMQLLTAGNAEQPKGIFGLPADRMFGEKAGAVNWDWNHARPES